MKFMFSLSIPFNMLPKEFFFFFCEVYKKQRHAVDIKEFSQFVNSFFVDFMTTHNHCWYILRGRAKSRNIEISELPTTSKHWSANASPISN